MVCKHKYKFQFLCGLVKDTSHCKNLFAKANCAILAAAKDIHNGLHSTNYCHICYFSPLKDK